MTIPICKEGSSQPRPKPLMGIGWAEGELAALWMGQQWSGESMPGKQYPGDFPLSPPLETHSLRLCAQPFNGSPSQMAHGWEGTEQ